MARREIIVDDLTGKELAEKVAPTTVTVDGTEYNLDLSASSKARLLSWLSGEGDLLPRQAAARPTSSSSVAATAVDKHGATAAEVRAWAIANGKKGKGGSPITESTKVLHQGLYDEYRDRTRD